MLQPGDSVPDFSLLSNSGEQVSAKSLRKQRYVLYFYPKDDTPGCTIEACAFRDALPKFQGLGVAVFGVSADSVAAHGRFASKYGLSFPLLSDPQRSLIEPIGAWVEKNMYGKKSFGILRCTAIVDALGKIEKVWEKVNTATHAEEVRAYLAGEPAPAAKPKRAAAKTVKA